MKQKKTTWRRKMSGFHSLKAVIKVRGFPQPQANSGKVIWRQKDKATFGFMKKDVEYKTRSLHVVSLKTE